MSNLRLDQFNNDNLEADVLGTLMNSKNIEEAMILLDNDCFYNTKNKLIFSVIYKLLNNNKPIDFTTVYAELGKDIEKVGISYLTDINLAGSSTSTLIPKCKKLIEYKKRFKTYKTINAVEQMFSDEEELQDILNYINLELENIISNNDEEDGVIIEALNETLEDIIRQTENGDKVSGIKTGLFELDNLIGGLNKGELILIAGRPGMGKSTLANNIAIQVAKTNKVAIFNLEMSKKQIFKKLLSCLSLLESEKIKKGLLNENELKRLRMAHKKLKELSDNIKLFDNTLYLDKIVNKCRILSKQGKLDVLIIDYLQLIALNTSKNSNREQEVSHISRTLKLLAKELGITVIALSQLSRACEQRADHRPLLSDLRESGSLEQDGSVILMTYRDEFYNRETEDKGIMEIICNKNRDGETKTIRVCWLPQYQKVENLETIFFKPVQEKAPF